MPKRSRRTPPKNKSRSTKRKAPRKKKRRASSRATTTTKKRRQSRATKRRNLARRMESPRYFANVRNLPDFLRAAARQAKLTVWDVAELYHKQTGDSILFTVIFDEEWDQ